MPAIESLYKSMTYSDNDSHLHLIKRYFVTLGNTIGNTTVTR